MSGEKRTKKSTKKEDIEEEEEIIESDDEENEESEVEPEEDDIEDSDSSLDEEETETQEEEIEIVEDDEEEDEALSDEEFQKLFGKGLKQPSLNQRIILDKPVEENKEKKKETAKIPENITQNNPQKPVVKEEKVTGMDIFNEATGKKTVKTEKEPVSVTPTPQQNAPVSTPEEGTTQEVSEPGEAQEIKVPKKKLEGHVIPTEPCWHVRRNKTGLTLPKEIRDTISDEQDYALVVKDTQLIFYAINEEDVPKLSLIRKSKPKEESEKKEGAKGGRKKRTIAKEPEGPQPDWGSYFQFEFEEQEKLKTVLQTAFDKFAAKPPILQEAMEAIKYSLVNFMNSNRMHDARIRQSVIFFLLDIVEKFDQPNLIDFIKDKIIGEIKSKFLYQLCLSQLAYVSFKVKRYEKAQEFIDLCLKDIATYTESENYAVIDSFKNLIIKLTRGVTFLIPQEQFVPIKNALMPYVNKMEQDYKIQIVDLLGRMRYIDDAVSLANKIMENLQEDSQTREEIKNLIKELEKKPI